MTTTEENQSMTECPLPPEPVTLAIVDYATNCPAERVLTSILMIDEQMADIEASVTPYLRNLSEQREKLLARAKTENIKEDAEAVIVEIKGKQARNKIQDREALKTTYPTEYAEIRKSQKAEIESKYKIDIAPFNDPAKEIDIDIPLGIADEKIGKKKVTEFVGHQPQTITYEVRRK